MTLLNKKLQSDFEDVVLPANVPQVPGQIHPAEARFLYWLVSKAYRGKGSIVEIGTWLGKSTVHLAAGIRDSGIKGCIHSFDRFIWGGAGDNKKAGFELPNGSDFMPVFLEYIEPLKDYVKVEKADFNEMSWKQSDNVEILFLDAPKSGYHLSICLDKFKDFLLPEMSLLVMQDYQHPFSYELPLIVDGLRNKLELCHAVQSGGTASFELKEKLTANDLAAAYDNMAKLTLDDTRKAWQRILTPLEDRVRNRVTLASVFHLSTLGAKEESTKIFKTITFDKRLYGGFENWSKIEKFRKLHSHLFDIFESEIRK